MTRDGRTWAFVFTNFSARDLTAMGRVLLSQQTESPSRTHIPHSIKAEYPSSCYYRKYCLRKDIIPAPKEEKRKLLRIFPAACPCRSQGRAAVHLI